ncbi:hypothetical protein LJR084_001204 [Variovorax sp. LjRoot84]|uniref:hypothetical protein n=1 Tax=Variovorax sp. LjRoot84 TaxID=3342340 RepID=UPI003ECC66AC
MEEELKLPPLLAGVHAGDVRWKRVEKIDHALLGYFLSCHLIIEHYMNEFLKTHYPGLDWDAARPSFAQQVALLSNIGLPEQFDCIPAIKHLNAVRNKLSHQVDYRIDAQALLPLMHYLEKASTVKFPSPSPKEILQGFTSICCATFAGNISRTARATGQSRG